MTYCVFSSDGISLRFEDSEMYDRFKREEEQLAVKFYNEAREKYGIWASNQNKFVSSPEELNEWDSRVMENLRDIYARV